MWQRTGYAKSTGRLQCKFGFFTLFFSKHLYQLPLMFRACPSSMKEVGGRLDAIVLYKGETVTEVHLKVCTYMVPASIKFHNAITVI